MDKSHYEKFTKKKNSVIKEEFKQEKKKIKKERAAYFDRIKAEKRAAKLAQKESQSTNKFKDRKPAETPSTTVDKSSSKNKFAPQKTAEQKKSPAPVSNPETKHPEMPLNKFLAHCGICSRRDAIALIADGKVKVNKDIVTEPGYKIQPNDEVFFGGKKLFVTKNLVYILLNKPKDYLTTTDDPQDRKTVLHLIKNATNERVYPIGRLDRNTSGVLLLTNDGDLTQKLSHPSYEVKKIYEAKLNKPLTKAHFDKIAAGLTLEDGPVQVDSLAYAHAQDKSVIGLEIHSGRNRIVRRIFESLGYDVKMLDRVMYAGLTKKNVERGKWRNLTEKEIRLLKFLNKGKGKKKS